MTGIFFIGPRGDGFDRDLFEEEEAALKLAPPPTNSQLTDQEVGVLESALGFGSDESDSEDESDGASSVSSASTAPLAARVPVTIYSGDKIDTFEGSSAVKNAYGKEANKLRQGRVEDSHIEDRVAAAFVEHGTGGLLGAGSTQIQINEGYVSEPPNLNPDTVGMDDVESRRILDAVKKYMSPALKAAGLEPI